MICTLLNLKYSDYNTGSRVPACVSFLALRLSKCAAKSPISHSEKLNWNSAKYPTVPAEKNQNSHRKPSSQHHRTEKRVNTSIASKALRPAASAVRASREV